MNGQTLPAVGDTVRVTSPIGKFEVGTVCRVVDVEPGRAWPVGVRAPSYANEWACYYADELEAVTP